jgi:hypothetical protein
MTNEKQLIDAKHLSERIRKKDGIVAMTQRAGKIYDLCYTILMHFLEEEPTVDAVEVVHGRWEQAEYHGFLRCSECKDVYIDDTWVADGKWNYCPNCGAKMDGGVQNA